MWDIPKFDISTCSNSVQLVPLRPIIISILYHHYKELMKCTKEVDEIMGSKVNSCEKAENIQEIQEKREIEETPTTLNDFLLTENDEIWESMPN
jgi:hypothetical protein